MHEAVERECRVVRSAVGIVDASTLGKIDIKGPDSGKFLNRLYINGFAKLAIGRCRYGFMLDENGMVMDDGVTARLGKNHYLMHTTTSGAANVMAWMERWLQTEWPDLKVYLTSVTDHWATVSLNGPRSRNVLARLCSDVDRDEIASEVYAELADLKTSDPDLDKIEREHKVKQELENLKRRTHKEG